MPISSQSGTLWINTDTSGGVVWTRVAQVTNWQFAYSAETLDTTPLTENDRTYIYGLRNLTGSCSIHWHEEGSTQGGNRARFLLRRLTDGSNTAANVVQFRMGAARGTTPDLLAPNDPHLGVNALITGYSMQMAVGEVLTASVSWQATGPAESFTL